jgi:hypothetical protein
MRRQAIRVLMLAMAAYAAACSDDTTMDTLAGPGVESGTLAVQLTSPFTNDGAVSFELRGEGIADVQGAPGTEIFTSETSGVVTVAVIGAGLTGALVTFRVPDISLAADYRASLVEVADERNELRRDLSGYSVAVTGID